MADDQSFHIRYGVFRPSLSILALGPAFSGRAPRPAS